ncbi:hypothetical protein [Micromonospora sp. CA-244673]|uniref:hypothetical protein n=1 Tax=Micromonospora sp. CA-244673 TaxID=3239958 RepID=UPI003D917417
MLVDGLPVPQALVELSQQGRWIPPSDPERFKSVFGDRAMQPVFLPLAQIRPNASWIDQIDYDEEVRQLYIGKPNQKAPPGDIDPHMSLLLGDLGPDQPFSLDFRRSLESPSVIYLGSRPGWVEVAPSFDALVDALDL